MPMNTKHINSAVTESSKPPSQSSGRSAFLSLIRGEGRGEGSTLSRGEFLKGTFAALAVLLAKDKSSAAAESKTRHRFLCCDYQGNQVAIIAPDGAIEWRYEAQTPQDCWMLPNGNVLFCYTHGAKEVSPDKKVVWEYQAPSQAQCHSCQPLPDGRVLVAECGMSRIVEAGRDGKIAKEITIPSKAKN